MKSCAHRVELIAHYFQRSRPLVGIQQGSEEVIRNPARIDTDRHWRFIRTVTVVPIAVASNESSSLDAV